MSELRSAALVGNPNAGKSALFNALTGARQKIANYPGVTVERKAGRLVLPSGEPVELTDLPGSYGLAATSPDEEVTRKVIFSTVPLVVPMAIESPMSKWFSSRMKKPAA